MLVINNRSTIEPSEARVARWLHNWTGDYAVPGVTIASYHIPNLRTLRSQQIDFVILTPQTITAVEIKGTHPDLTDGEIIAEANGPWRHSESDLDPVHTREQDTHPIDQALSAAYTLKALTVKHNPGSAFVTAVVVIVAPRRLRLTLRAGAMPTGCDVVLGNAGLRAWFHRNTHGAPVWAAEQAYSLLNAMNLGDQLTITDLVAEGFPTLEDLRRAQSKPTPAAATQRPARSRRAASHPVRHHRRHHAAPHRSAGTPKQPHLNYRPTPPRRHRTQQLAAVTFIAAVLATTWWLYVHFNPAPASTPIPGTHTTSTIDQPAGRPAPDAAKP